MSELTHRSASSPAGLTSGSTAAASDVELTSTLATVDESRPDSSILPDRPDANAQSSSDATGAAVSNPSPASNSSTSLATPASSSRPPPSNLPSRAASVGGSRPPSISEDIQQHLLQNQNRSHSTHHSHHHASRHHHHTSIGVDQQPSSTSPPSPQAVDPHRSLLAQAAPNDLVFLNSSLLQELQYYDVLTRELSSELESSLQHVSVLSKEVSAAHTSAEEALVQVEVLRAERRRENVVREEERKKKWKEVKELKVQIEKLKAAVRQQGMNPQSVINLNFPNGAATSASSTISSSSMPPQQYQIPSPMNAHSRAVLLTTRDSGASIDESEVRIDMSETVNTTTTNASTTLLPRKRAQLRKPKQRSSETQASSQKKKKKKSKKPKGMGARINENSLVRSSESEDDSDDEGSTSDSDEEQKMLHDGEESDSSDDEESKFGENEKDSLNLVQSIDGIGGSAPGFKRTLSSAQKNAQPTTNNVSQMLQPHLSRQSSSESQQSIASPSNVSFGTASPFVPSIQQLSSSLPTNLSVLPDSALSPAPPAASPHPLLHLGLVDDPTAPVPATEYLSLYEAHAIAQERITRLENRLVDQQRNWVMYLDLVQSRTRVGVRRRENSSQTGMVLNTPAEAVLGDFAQEKLVFVTPSIWRAVAKSLMARDRARKEEKIRQEEAALAFTAAPSQPLQIYTSTSATVAATTTSTSSSSASSSTSAATTENATAIEPVVPSKSTEASAASVATSAFHDADLVIPIDDATASNISRTSELSVVPPKQTFYYTPATTGAATSISSDSSSSQTATATSSSATGVTTTAASSSSSTFAQEDGDRVIIPRVQVVDQSSSSSSSSSSTTAASTAATSTNAAAISPSPPASRSLSPMPMPPTLQMSPPVSPRKPLTPSAIATTTGPTATAAPVSLFTRTAPNNAPTSSSLPSSLQSPTALSSRIAPSIITAQPRPGVTIHGFSPAGRATTTSLQASSVVTPTASSFATTASSPRSTSNTTTSTSINKYLDMALQSSARRKANLHAAGSNTGAAKQLDFSKATVNTANASVKPNEEAKTSTTVEDSNSNAPINGQTKH